MSRYLWQYYLEDDVESFRQFLESAGRNARHGTQRAFGGERGNAGPSIVGSPDTLGTSPILLPKARKQPPAPASTSSLTRADINSRDRNGLTILHHAASSSSHNSVDFAAALLEHPLVDLYAQDIENGWTSLHRAFYFGNIAIARSILHRDVQDATGLGSGAVNQHAGGLIKIKDKEGNGPLDLFATTIKDRTLRPTEPAHQDMESSGDFEDDVAQGDSGDDDGVSRKRLVHPATDLQADEVFTFGSNRNVTLGFGDEDDRQYPERIMLRRPDHLLQRFYREHVALRQQSSGGLDSSDLSTSSRSKPVSALPSIIRSTPLIIQDVQMAKLHTAVLTTDPESNLYMCGHGPGGRLGTGDENTRYQFVCIEGGALARKKIVSVALGQNHSLALSDQGDTFSWGNNGFGQLGYSLPRTGLRDEDPISTLPRQIFGPLKKEIVIGVAASRIHSVVHTPTSLYTFGKNEGQLGIMDADARSLEIQDIPRKVAASLFSSAIVSVTAIDRATVCLLENHEVWVFANYGYTRITFPLDGFTNYFLKNSFLTTKYDTSPNQICKVTSGGDTICALSSSGEVFTVAVSKRLEAAQDSSTSTTNPAKIRGALSQPQRIWSLKKGHMAARDVGVDQDGSIILSTEAGSVYRRVRRAKIKDATAAGTGEYRPKDYKFSRIPGLTRVMAVRASSYGAYAAVRKDCDVLKTQITVSEPTLWKDLLPLLPFGGLASIEEASDDDEPTPRFWRKPSAMENLKKRVLASKDLEAVLTDTLQPVNDDHDSGYDMDISTTVSDVRIPIHQFMFSSRSRVVSHALAEYRRDEYSSIPDVLCIETNKEGRTVVTLQGLDVLTMFNLVLYLYTDTIIDFWHYTRQHPKLAFRYRQVRVELMKLAASLQMRHLETAARQMVEVTPSFDADMELAIKEPGFFDEGDVAVQLADAEIKVHSTLVCQRCPFFESLFKGRAGGRWLADRLGERQEATDTININLQHLESNIFQLVLRHIYADTGEELFDEIIAEDLDAFLDLVMDVMSVANELMLDRLSQICQKIIGRYVNARNVCQLLNAIAPSAVTEFKDAALEYLCLSLEAVLQNGLLDDLDEDLLYELDAVVRENQLACLPFVRSGRAEAVLLEKYPELAERIDRARQAKIDSIVLHNKFAESDARVSTSFQAHSLEELANSPMQARSRRKPSKEPRLGLSSPIVSPTLRGKSSAADLMFDMDDEGEGDASPSAAIKTMSSTVDATATDQLPPLPAPATGSPPDAWYDNRGKPLSPAQGHPLGSFSPMAPRTPTAGPSSAAQDKTSARPWGAAPLQSTKLDMKDIMAQTTSPHASGIALGLSAQSKRDGRLAGAFTTKLSQKERKKMQQTQQTQQTQQLTSPVTPTGVERAPPEVKPSSPWQTVSSGSKIALQDVLTAKQPPAAAPTPPQKPSRSATTPHLTMRQTVANPTSTGSKEKEPAPTPQPPAAAHRTVSSPANPVQPPTPRPAPGPQQARTPSSTRAKPRSSKSTPQPQPQPTPQSTPGFSISQSTDPIPPKSIRHIPLPGPAHGEASLQLSMQEILSQQAAEKIAVKDAVAKRSLQDIQQEQQFLEWWEKERERELEREREEEEKAARTAARAARGGKSGRGGRGKGGRGRGGGVGGEGGNADQEKANAPSQAVPIGPVKGRASAERGGRGDHRGGRGRARGGAASASIRGGGPEA